MAGPASLLFSLRIAAGSIWEITASLAPGSPLFLIAQSIRSIPGVAPATCLLSRLFSHAATCGLLIHHPHSSLDQIGRPATCSIWRDIRQDSHSRLAHPASRDSRPHSDPEDDVRRTLIHHSSAFPSIVFPAPNRATARMHSILSNGWITY